MENNKQILYKRWYDTKPYANGVLEILKNLSLQSHYDIAREVLKIIEAIKINSRELDEPPLSLGAERVFGLFSQNYKRRWYDKNLPINRIFKSASSLQDEDFQNIMQGMFTSLKDENEQ
ncbi:MAG: hypothetical protein IJ003_02125 [Candidatus Gastranaerophilales bacterium]|nr:hypothetical protein [Candidatus Gastranaerophilales bacterium]